MQIIKDGHLTLFLKRHSMWLSLLCHLLLLAYFSITLSYKITTKRDDSPELYVPSYTYQEQSRMSSTVLREQKQTQVVSKDGIEKQVKSPSQEVEHRNQARPQTKSKPDDPIHLVGDKNKIAKPLIKLLGKALTANLEYPKLALDFNLRGKVLVGLVLHPDGSITDVKIVKSSNAGVLDQEAIRAVNAISPVKDVNLYLKQPEFIIFGIIFG